ncbi:leucyl aminopeptidase family protein [Rubrivirga sp. IMCC43871]|uniref:leucyl aminopeptidase family protein n=1 Tax=Rubrivirga sp. IMCC43871 TaxID=3391575 RepID=UPI00398F98C0
MTDVFSGDPLARGADLVAFVLDADAAPDDPALATALADAKTCKGAALVVRADGSRTAVVVPGDQPGLERWRWAGASAAKAAASVEAGSVVIVAPDGADADTVGALVEGFRLGAYRYDDFRTGDRPPTASLAVRASDEHADTVRAADLRAEATNWARDLVNTPPDAKMPAALADRIAARLKGTGLTCRIWDEDEIAEHQMGGLLGVNRGSLDPARFVILEWAPEGHATDAPVVLVGKTVTYDTGGLSLKPTKNSMDKMKADMGGGAAVAGAMLGAATLGLPVRVIALLPMSDNRPGGRAYAPGDVLTMHSGATVEVMNTDAEGRLLLADALSYARELSPAWVLDAATLTGAQGVALGERVAAVIARPDDRALADRVHAAGEATGDLAWPLPLYPHYREQLKSDTADLSNVGGAMAGTITAAAFLEAFTRTDDEPAYPWVHVDLARPAFLDAAYGYRPKGGTGFGVRLLLDLLADG